MITPKYNEMVDNLTIIMKQNCFKNDSRVIAIVYSKEWYKLYPESPLMTTCPPIAVVGWLQMSDGQTTTYDDLVTHALVRTEEHAKLVYDDVLAQSFEPGLSAAITQIDENYYKCHCGCPLSKRNRFSVMLTAPESINTIKREREGLKLHTRWVVSYLCETCYELTDAAIRTKSPVGSMFIYYPDQHPA